ncbi:bile acid:sodium symporter [Novosphingobium sp. 1949]|uniref:Bile acid:sodium symporter n=1 Tax=Novosphingobium organovorum TaxID=2930092 RepID=A0ABT0BH95_9SPHN|nr:bile acid:sodium symporter family protein [Novosphingobium organovorum]MCJ2184438.1 bile acid:sodium symporter [Novosphingobium organovorum]
MQRVSYIPRVDPFLLCLVCVVAAASLLPVHGVGARVVDGLADLAVVLLFFLHGAKLSREAIWQGLGNLRLHALTFASTYGLFPAVGLATVALIGGWINPDLIAGLLFLTLLPSTVQSSIAFTAMARGNVAAAVCSASLSNLLGIFLTPLLVSLFLRTAGAGGGFNWHAVESIVLQLLVPFLGGHLLRPWIGGFVTRYKAILTPVDRGSILLIVYSAFSAAVVKGIWHRLGMGDLVCVLVLSGVILTVVMLVNLLAGRLAGLARADLVVLLFCGSKKSLVSGVPMAGALFAPAQVGMIVLPLMIFHQLQLFVCAWLAGHFARTSEPMDDADTPSSTPVATVPRSAEEIAAAAAACGLTIPEPCAAGVAANLALLESHVARLRGEEAGQA